MVTKQPTKEDIRNEIVDLEVDRALSDYLRKYNQLSPEEKPVWKYRPEVPEVKTETEK